ncbi:MAG: hypothetical protein VB858_16545, partial [Planctomycetaceae bacterium]
MKVRNDQWLAGWRNRAAWVAGIFLVVLLPLGFTLVEGITRPRRIRDEDAVAQSSGSANPVSSLADVNRSVTNWGMGSRSVPAPVPEKPRGSDEFSVAGAVPLSDSQWIGADEPERQVQQRSVLSVIENLRGRDDVMSSEELVSTFLGSNGEAARTGGLAQVIRSEQDSQSDPASAGLRPETHTPSESEELPGAVANVVAVASAGPGEPQAGEASPVEKATPATHLQPVQ